MGEIGELGEEEMAFLLPYLPPHACSNALASGAVPLAHEAPHWRPYVTLTYASSLDSMISLAPGMRTVLSGPETKAMTHLLRLKHDAILVGVGTAVADDPSLNCRYPGVTLHTQPRPVILDPNGRWNFDKSKVRTLADTGQGKTPWIIHAAGSLLDDPHRTAPSDRMYLDSGEGVPRSASAFDEETSAPPPEKLEWNSILAALKQKGIESIMIEGGATIINNLLLRPELVDATIITIAPTFLGTGGVVVCPPARTEAGQRVNAAHIKQTAWRQFGQDVVLCGRPLRD